MTAFRNKVSIFAIAIVACSCVGIGFPAATPDLHHDEVSLIPGECLLNNSITCIYSNGANHHTNICLCLPWTWMLNMKCWKAKRH